MKKLTLIFLTLLLTSCGTTKKVSPNDLLEITKKQIENKEWDKAEKNLTELIKLYPNNAELLFQRGYVREKNLKFKECIEDFTKVIELKPEKHTTRTNRGYAYRNIGEYQKAINDFTAELEVNPNAYSYEHRSVVHYLTKNYNEALKDVNISIEKAPDNSISYKTRALIYKAMDSKENACADKEKAIELKLLEKYPKYKTDISELNKYCTE
ncbi:tetratricopeptide repeat protein [Lacinutrix neustonica]|uniref:Tetratricopeptide repeat protein n=1 Tax=Lacinutrix neustonica TaxID=2980107 RepID=A0A9E8MWI8_9FLAO|nr:tetratricopeptide repeat protein [Lacinutrix neustonica]WAC02908.1 tetratricopeptide repeat protein [Lacinutrix neustonica]